MKKYKQFKYILALVFKINIILITSTSTGFAASIYDRFFLSGHLSELNAGDMFSYSETETISSNAPKSAVLEFEVLDQESMKIDRVFEDQSQRLGSFPTSVGNPLNMYFLEKIISSMATQTGGSPFYIRNRLKASLLHEAVESEEGICADFLNPSKEASCFRFFPFSEDEARQKMAGYADLEIGFVVDPNLTNPLLLIEAITRDEAQSYSLRLEQIQ